MSIKCGNHGSLNGLIRHESVSDVRYCFEHGPIDDFSVEPGQKPVYPVVRDTGAPAWSAFPFSAESVGGDVSPYTHDDFSAGDFNGEQQSANEEWALLKAEAARRERLQEESAYLADDQFTCTITPHEKLERVTEDGMYILGETIYKVQRAVHGSGRLYAKRLEVQQEPARDANGKVTIPAIVKFVYEPGAIHKLRAGDKLSMEEAQKFGALYGTCIRCGKVLTREDSIERKMGSTCYAKHQEFLA